MQWNGSTQNVRQLHLQKRHYSYVSEKRQRTRAQKRFDGRVCFTIGNRTSVWNAMETDGTRISRVQAYRNAKDYGYACEGRDAVFSKRGWGTPARGRVHRLQHARASRPYTKGHRQKVVAGYAFGKGTAAVHSRAVRACDRLCKKSFQKIQRSQSKSPGLAPRVKPEASRPSQSAQKV